MFRRVLFRSDGGGELGVHSQVAARHADAKAQTATHQGNDLGGVCRAVDHHGHAITDGGIATHGTGDSDIACRLLGIEDVIEIGREHG